MWPFINMPKRYFTKKSLAQEIITQHSSYNWKDSFYTSKHSNQNQEEGNTLACIAFREIARGYSHLQTFSRAVNMTINTNVFNIINDNLHEAYTSAEDPMLNAAK